MDKETKKFIKECDCGLIQKLWDYNDDDLTHCKETGETEIYKSLGEGRYPIWLPSLSQIIAEIEKIQTFFAWDFKKLPPSTKLYDMYINLDFNSNIRGFVSTGETPEIACIKALKQVLKEG